MPAPSLQSAVAFGAGAAIAVGLAWSVIPVPSPAIPDDQLTSRPFLRADKSLCAGLSDTLGVFLALDAAATETFLDALDKLGSAQCSLHRGERSSALLAGALASRREGNKCLRCLVRLARQQRPVEAAGLSQDFDFLAKHLNDVVYNCEQQSSLNLMEAARTPA